MNKQQLTERLARQSHRSRGQAADAVDTLVYKLLKELRTAGSPPQIPAAQAPVDPAINRPDSGKKEKI